MPDQPTTADPAAIGPLELVEYPHPALLRPTKPLARLDDAIREAVERMFEIMYAAQGIGLALSEDFEDIQKHASMVGAGFPYIKSVPDDLELIYIESPRPDGPYGAAGVGELPLTSPHVSIINAINNACGVRITHLPARPEKVLAKLQGK